MWRLGEKGVKLAATRFDRAIALGMSSALLTLCVICLFGDRFFRVEIICPMWIACALVEDLSREREKAQQVEAAS
jgi:hypothetical protein